MSNLNTSEIAQQRFGATGFLSSFGGPARVLSLVVAATALTACAHDPGLTPNSAARLRMPRHSAMHPAGAGPVKVARQRPPFRTPAVASGRPALASKGLASYYWEGTKTANGEKFDGSELTAAHRSLPFGTRLKVTDEVSGRSVTVRVNDRGPFIRGREVDLSYSAAKAIGMLDKGVTNVRLDVVE